MLGVEYKLILTALIDSEQMLLSIEAQLCTLESANVLPTKAFITAVLQCPTTFVQNVGGVCGLIIWPMSTNVLMGICSYQRM